ncbi:hypothetical protein BKA93DRAFT_814100 [Sparassis latifolia]
MRLLMDRSTTPSSTIASPESAHLTSQTRTVPALMATDRNPDIHLDARTATVNAPSDNEPHSLSIRLLQFLGYTGNNARARRDLISLVWNLSFGLAQFAVIITLLAFSAHHESPTSPGLSEWEACARPLGVWNSLWLVRVALGCVLSVWGWFRERATRINQERRHAEDAEAGRSEATQPTSARSGTSGRPAPARGSRLSGAGGQAETNADSSINSKYPHLYARLSFLTSFISLAWFLTAHILEYTSVKTCRLSSPHLWWLTFGILCILYLTILEIFLLGLLVFFVGPVIYLFWNIVLLCLGRHPLQNIKPEIGKLPKSIVDEIPLVLYIPPPPDSSTGGFSTPTVPPPTHSYPPKPPARRSRKRRFAFLRKSSKGDSGGSSSKGLSHKVNQPTGAWEDRWEPGEYPFVRLEGNRAACAICLLDFEEPKRVGDKDAVPTTATPENEAEMGGEPDTTNAPAEEVQVEEVSEEERDALMLGDAGEGAQPLRLLACGHVFHKTCVDPWLTDVSGRCPICQRPVEVPQRDGKKDKRSRWT